MPMRLTIDDEDLSLVMAFLGIGMLSVIQRGVLPPEVGIGTLGQPRFWEPLADNAAVHRNIIATFQESDELDALRKVSESAYTEAIERMLNQLDSVLAGIERPAAGFIGPAWDVSWSTTAITDPHRTSPGDDNGHLS